MIQRLAALVLSASLLTAANLITDNSSFETGRWGHDAVPCAFIRNWPSFIHPEITDAAAAHGKFSLKMVNASGMDSVFLVFPAFKIPARTKLTISFFAKADNEKTPVTANIACGWYRAGFTKGFSLSTEWKRYSYDVEVMADPVKESASAGNRGVYALYFMLDSVSKPVFSTVWMDAVQVEANPLSDYAPAKKLEAAIDMEQYREKRTLVYAVGESENAAVSIYASDIRSSPFTGSYAVYDAVNASRAAEGKLAGTIDENGHGRARITLPTMKRRLYRVEAHIAVQGQTAKAQRLYGAVNDMTSVPQRTKFFGGSIEMQEEARTYQIVGKDASYRMGSWRMDPSIYAKLAKAVGWQWVHAYPQLGYGIVAPEKGKFQWEDADRYADIHLNAGLEIMALMSSHGNYHQWYFEPKWMLTGKPSDGGNNAGKGAKLPDTSAVEELSYEIAKHFAGKVNIWESWNEPGVKMREYEYLPILKAFYSGVKRGYPDAKVLGLCGTWDLSGDLYGWVKLCLKLGAADYMDGIGIHGYHTKDRDYGYQVRRIAKEMIGRDMPVWDTESGKVIYDPYGFPSYFADWEIKPDEAADVSRLADFVVKHSVNELASGLKRASYFNLDSTYSRLGQPSYGMIQYDGSPDASLIAHNAVIDMMKDAVFVKDVPAEGGSVVYVFDRPEGAFAVYWNDTVNTTATIGIPPANAAVLDVLAGSIPFSGSSSSVIPLSASPRYLTTKGRPDALIKAFETMDVAGLSPVKVTRTRMGVDNASPALIIDLENRSTKEQSFSVTAGTKPPWIRGRINVSATIPPLTMSSVLWPFTSSDGGSGNGSVFIEMPRDTVAAPCAFHVFISRAGTPVIDGDGSDAAWKNTIPLGSIASVSSANDDTALYFLFRVKDDAPFHYRDASVPTPAWKSDNIELFIDWDRDGDMADSVYNADDTQLVFTAKGVSKVGSDEISKGGDNYAGNKNFSVDKVRFVSRTIPGGYTAEIAIPWECVKTLGVPKKKIIGFTMSVRDMDTRGEERSRVIWRGDNNVYRDTSDLGLLIIDR